MFFYKLLKIVFIGGIIFSHALLSTILEKNFDVKMIFTYNDSKKNLYSDFSAFDSIAKKYDVPLQKVNNINDIENVNLIKKIRPDLILVLGWSQLLKKEILSIPNITVIGSHPTELPKYRGRAPIPWTILKELKESALTFFYIQEGIDDGDILDQENFLISEKDDSTSLYNKIIEIGKIMIVKNLEKIKNNCAPRIKQLQSNFIEDWKKRTPEDGYINWSNTSKDIHKLIRASTFPYPGAFTYFKQSKITIWKSNIIKKNNSPGIISNVDSNGVLIGTADESILITSISINDEKEINPMSFFSNDDVGNLLGE